MKTREQVKKGLLLPSDAMTRISQDSKTYGWLKRRLSKPITETPQEESKPLRKYRHGHRKTR